MDDASDPAKIGQETETPQGRGADGRFPSSTDAAASKNAEKMRGRPFEPGHPGGPGRPSGSRNKATVLLDKMAEDDASDIGRTVIDAAKGGDMRAADLVLSRIWPVRKGGRTVKLDLPAIDTADDLVKALGKLAESVGAGELTPDEGQAVATILETKRKAIETVALETRIAALEQDRK